MKGRPETGEEGTVSSDFAMGPAFLDKYPASTAKENALLISSGLLAFAIAEFTNTASHPISIAFDASDGIPIPASNIIALLG